MLSVPAISASPYWQKQVCIGHINVMKLKSLEPHWKFCTWTFTNTVDHYFFLTWYWCMYHMPFVLPSHSLSRWISNLKKLFFSSFLSFSASSMSSNQPVCQSKLWHEFGNPELGVKYECHLLHSDNDWQSWPCGVLLLQHNNLLSEAGLWASLYSSLDCLQCNVQQQLRTIVNIWFRYKSRAGTWIFDTCQWNFVLDE